MPKMHYLTIFQNRQALGAQRPLIFNIGDLKLGDLTKLCFVKQIVTKSNFKKSVNTSFL